MAWNVEKNAFFKLRELKKEKNTKIANIKIL